MSHLVRIGEIDVAPLRQAVAQHEGAFELLTFRQTAPGTPHSDTQSLYLRMPTVINRSTIFAGLECRDYPLMDVPEFRAAVDDVARMADRKAARAMIVRLRPGGRITRHSDQGGYADATERYHLAIDTNDDCVMRVGGEEAHAAEGEIYFFDKHVEHEVVNAGPTDRIHLIVDVWRDRDFIHKPVITYQEERFSEAKHETVDLVAEHWREITENPDTDMKPDLDWDWFANADELGLLRAFTVRVDGVLVGYIVFLLMTLPHYKTFLVACDDAFFLKKEYRNGMVGVKMFREAEKMLAGYGVKRVIYHEKHKAPTGKVFKYLGYRPVETLWWKELASSNVRIMPRPKLPPRSRPLRRISLT